MQWENFPNKGVSHLVIIDTRWLVDKFRALISPLEFLEKKRPQKQTTEQLKQCKISEKSLHEMWEGEDIPFLIELMKKFDLLIPFSPSVKDTNKISNDSDSTDDNEVREAKDTQFLVSSILPYLKQSEYEKKHFRENRMVKVYTATQKTNNILPI